MHYGESRVKVNGITLNAPQGHIYNSPNLPPSYDSGPWRYIHDIVGNRYNCLDLIDIGANIGDSVAYFRSISAGHAYCIEASQQFCDYFQSNSDLLEPATLIHALAVPSESNSLLELSKLYSFQSGSQTGSTAITDDPSASYRGEYIQIRDLLQLSANPKIFKSDTDGFDGAILLGLASDLAVIDTDSIPIIFVEGPSLEQIRSSDPSISCYINASAKLSQIGYNFSLFSNFGTLFCECGHSTQVLASCLKGISQSISIGRAYCHYFDLVFYK